MNKTLRGKLLIWFSIFSLLTIIILITFTGAYFNRKAALTNVVNNLYDIHSQVLKNIMIFDYFITNETINPNYYETGRSHYLAKHEKNISNITLELEELYNDPLSDKLDITGRIDSLRVQFEKYELLLLQLDKLLLERGFKDYGLIGEMLNYVNKLESVQELDRAKILSLRSLEKDYFIRNDLEYAEQLNLLSSQLANRIGFDYRMGQVQKDYLLILISKYTKTFNNVVDLDHRIGLRSGSGLKGEIDDFEGEIIRSFENTILYVNQRKSRIFKEMEIYYLLCFALLIVSGVFFGLFISRRVTNPLAALAAYIGNLVRSDLNISSKLNIKNSYYEIEILYKEFLNLISKIQKHEKERKEERAEAEKAVMENELKYRQLTDMLPQCVFETNEEGNLTYVNRNWLETFGYTIADIKEGLNLVEIIISDNKNFIIEGKEFNSNEFQALRKNGATFPALVYSNAILQEGKIEGYRGIIIDHTERKKYVDALENEKRKAEKSDRLKSAFLANMSHEIRTPMNAILGFTELLARSSTKEDDKNEYISHIKNSGEVLLNLIDDIIDIAKIEAGELKITEKDYDINEMMNDLERTFSQSINQNHKKSIKLVIEKQFAKSSFYIKTDPFRLKQIMTNLLHNALKFTEQGEVKFGYRIEKGNIINFYVTDTGIGMSRENQGIVFDRFRQVEESTNRKYNGTGLGLTITKNIVDLMKGNIKLESKPGEGSSFYVSLPYKDSEKKTFNEKLVEEEKKQVDWSGKTILIAEDDKNNFHFLKSALKITKMKILHASNGMEALDLVKKHKEIELILMDIQMPEMNGYEATSKIKSINKNIVIIAQTAYAMAGEKEKSQKAGCDDYIAKPIDLSSLLMKISLHLGESQYQLSGKETVS